MPAELVPRFRFYITAIPVLYLYLRHIQYPPAATRRTVSKNSATSTTRRFSR